MEIDGDKEEDGEEDREGHGDVYANWIPTTTQTLDVMNTNFNTINIKELVFDIMTKHIFLMCEIINSKSW